MGTHPTCFNTVGYAHDGMIVSLIISGVTHTMGDLLVWSDGTYCARHSNARFNHPSDDYILLAEGTVEWFDFCISQGLL